MKTLLYVAAELDRIMPVVLLDWFAMINIGRNKSLWLDIYFKAVLSARNPTKIMAKIPLKIVLCSVALSLTLLIPVMASINVVAHFVGASNGLNPEGGLIVGSDGNFYGTTRTGGKGGVGTVFKINSAGVLTTLASFDRTIGGSPTTIMQAADGNFYGAGGIVFKMTPTGVLTNLASLSPTTGYSVVGNLVTDGLGNFYGATVEGSTNNSGTIFRVTSGGSLTVLYSFTGEGCSTGLIRGLDGNFYGGTISHLGAGGRLFKITPAGVLTTFATLSNADGIVPNTLLQTADGNFYGSAEGGGIQNAGTIFKVDSNGVVTVLTYFDGQSVANPNNLVQGADGNFYGSTTGSTGSPPYHVGTFFSVTPSGALSILKTFPNETGDPLGPFVKGPDGNFYGTTDGNMPGNTYGTVFKITPTGALNSLFVFNNAGAVTPNAGVIQAADGNFYGTTYSGGAFGDGTIYKMTPSGVITTLVSFDGTNGKNPYASLVQVTNGDFYGTTFAGGTSNLGTIFKMTPAGVLTTLVSFSGTNGQNPYAPLIRGKDGFLYGTTFGTFNDPAGRDGTVFKVTKDGVLTTLVNFTGPNGGNPYAGLLQASDGNFYGTTTFGGGTAGPYSGGTLFRLTPAGVLTTLVTFTGPNGYRPNGTLIQGVDGNLYGTTDEGTSATGTIFKSTLTGNLTTLVDFGNSYPIIGGYLLTSLYQAQDGNFYGISTYGGGVTGIGMIFQMTPAGVLTNFGNFDGTNGALPMGKLTGATDGYLYGTASGGGSASSGTVYKVPIRPQTITFPALPQETIGSLTPITLKATASSGLPVTYRVVGGSGEISGNVLTIDGGGPLTIAADQAGNSIFAPAPEVTTTLNVGLGTQIITFPSIPNQTQTTGTVQLQAASNGGSPIYYTVVGPAQIINVYPSPFSTDYYQAVQYYGTGKITVTAYADANESFKAASATVVFYVNSPGAG